MANSATLPEKFFDVLRHEGVVSIVSWASGEPHLVNTWNSYLVITEDGRILVPVFGMRKTQQNVEVNPKIILAVGSKEVPGYKDYPGTGFVVEGTGKFLAPGSGPEYDRMKEKFSFANRVLEVTVTSAKQKI